MFKSKGKATQQNAKPLAKAKGSHNGGRPSFARPQSTKSAPNALIYKPEYISAREKEEILRYLNTLHPIWEMRYSKNNPPPENQKQRPLLRPVYWLGNWQFACLNYYHPPKGIYNRCVLAEKFPSILEYLIQKIETLVKEHYEPRDIPRGWHLNTCLINYYGDQILENGKRLDCARVGEHKDFEPGPVASVSFGERALFQFVSSQGTESKSSVIVQQWLEDSSLQIFGSDKFKKHLFHRVQRVDTKEGHHFPLRDITNFETRRINLTFRYVPDEHIVPFSRLPESAQEDVREYVEQIGSNFPR
ncbi:MAG TPA: alpha-ketoglutarate-dependent dioxygenase AlkB [Bdellovibrio sp.]|nr:alpha-ketoglutarate-dependent dioxygenase AlkB [Bdellovibrio sp.]